MDKPTETNEALGLMTAREAAAFLRVSLSTLQLIERKGALIPFRTPGGHRRYSRDMVEAYLESTRKPKAAATRPDLLS